MMRAPHGAQQHGKRRALEEALRATDPRATIPDPMTKPVAWARHVKERTL